MAVLECWQATIGPARSGVILPDGCRDVIRREVPGSSPEFFITAVSGGPEKLHHAAGTSFLGFRLLPGLHVDQAALLNNLGLDMDEKEIRTTIAENTRRDPAVEDALACLAQTAGGPGMAAATLGVGLRRLQRLLRRHTGHTPAFWARLARVRRAQAQLGPQDDLSQVAHACGFADQAHMGREFRHWFGITPGQFARADKAWRRQHMVRGYGG